MPLIYTKTTAPQELYLRALYFHPLNALKPAGRYTEKVCLNMMHHQNVCGIVRSKKVEKLARDHGFIYV